MSASIYGQAAIGLEINWSDICKGRKKVKRFDHNYPEDFKVDPKTGKDLWIEQSVFINGWDSDNNTLLGYKALYDVESYESNRKVIICLRYCETDDLMYSSKPAFVHLPTQKDMDGFKEKLSNLGLWNENKFGLYALGKS